MKDRDLKMLWGRAGNRVLTLARYRPANAAEIAVVQYGDVRSPVVPRPNEDALRFAQHFNAGDRYIDGSAIEIHSNFNLNSGLSLAETGWPPEMVRLSLLSGDFDKNAILADSFFESEFNKSEEERARIGQRRVLSLLNGPKYAVVDISPNVPERDDLTISLRKTDYYSVMQVIPGLKRSPDRRRTLGHIMPSRNRVPHSFCNHFLAVLRGNDLLAIQRDKTLDYNQGKWSFSGEEQCFASDLAKEDAARMKHFLLRTAVEEIFALGTSSDEEQLRRRMRSVEPHLHSMRVWSLFLEEPLANFGVLSVFEVKLSRSEYVNTCTELIRKGLGKASGEGNYYTVSTEDALHLLRGKSIIARPLFGTKEMTVSAEDLHPISRYRLSRFLGVLARMHSH